MAKSLRWGFSSGLLEGRNKNMQGFPQALAPHTPEPSALASELPAPPRPAARAPCAEPPPRRSLRAFPRLRAPAFAPRPSPPARARTCAAAKRGQQRPRRRPSPTLPPQRTFPGWKAALQASWSRAGRAGRPTRRGRPKVPPDHHRRHHHAPRPRAWRCRLLRAVAGGEPTAAGACATPLPACPQLCVKAGAVLPKVRLVCQRAGAAHRGPCSCHAVWGVWLSSRGPFAAARPNGVAEAALGDTWRAAKAEVAKMAARGLPGSSWPLPWLPLLLLLASGCPGQARAGRSQVKALSDGGWRELLQGEWMVEFYAPWCPACQNLQPEWESFAEWGEDLEVNIAKVDVTEQPGLSGRFIITALPTIYHCKDGEFRRYQGPRTKTDFINFISDKEWKSIEPVSSWFGPSSFLMSSMSALFQLSMWIRNCHNYFTGQLGIPVWGSYAIFTFATLFSGLLLGLVMVFLADCICPSKKHRPLQHPHQKKQLEAAQLPKMFAEDLDEDDLPYAEVEAREPQRPVSTPSAVRQRAVIPAAEEEERA
ncbi:thioredoxin-related transmembrane protein 1-like [Elgaria multicarinata webbii]|uniref:thioredoxin-related transmembrane protein 1-like n=1 Tax=Elgaria multicarinata webbii TaxID=159646 RepID=UPI002FCCE651